MIRQSPCPVLPRRSIQLPGTRLLGVWLLVGGLVGGLAAQSVWAQSSAPVPGQVVRLETAELSTQWLYPERTAPAQVVARNESRLAAEVSGTLRRWTADVGSTVKRGAVLAQIDPTDYELALQRALAAQSAARARLQLAEAQLQRSRELVAQGFFSQEALAVRETEVALARADTDAADAQRSTAQRQLDKTTLRAPFDGSVVQRLAQAGEAVAPGSLLYVLAESGYAEVSAALPPQDAASLRQGRSARFEPQNSADRFPLNLLRVSPTLDAAARTQAVRLGFAPAPGAAGEPPPPGTVGVVRWTESQPHIPAALVVRRRGTLGVFVEEAGLARFTPLPGAEEARAVATRLPGSTRVVVQGQATLQDGQPLR